MSLSKTKDASKSIDRRSYILGMMTAFAECVTNECKKIALSPPFYPEDYDTVVAEAEKIADEQGILLWYDENRDIPESRRLNWFVLYKFSDMLEAYRNLRGQGYNPAWHFAKFSDLFSYGTAWGEGADAVVTRMRQRKNTKFINSDFDSAALVAGHLSTFFTSAFPLPTSDFQPSSLPSGAASSP
jgi:hypothetical protein